MRKKQIADIAGLTACAVLGIWMVAYWFETARSVWAHYFGFPLQDYWRSVVNLPRYEHFDLSVLGEQHNEHRVAVPEIIFALDDLLFRAHEYLPIALGALCQIGTFGLLAWTLWTERQISAKLRAGMIFLGGILLGWPGIAYVISWPFLIAWTLVQFLVTLALVALTRGWLWVTLFCGAIATFTAGHGMLIWPILLLAAAMQLSWKRLAAIAVTGAASVMLYFYHLVPSVDAQTHLFLQNLSWFFGFLASMLSMPFSADRRVFGLWLGPLSILLFTGIFSLAARRRLLAERSAIVLFGVCMFSIATILVCGMGRTLPTYWEYPTAKVARYLSVPVAYWASLIVATLWVLARGRSGTSPAWIALAVFSCGIAYQLPRVNPWVAKQMDIYSRAEGAMVAFEAGVKCSGSVEEDLYPHPDNLWPWNRILQQRRLSVYASDRFRWVGRPVAEVLAIHTGERVPGRVSTTLSSGCAMQLAGLMENSGRELVLVNEKGIIAGLGRRFRAELPLYLPNRWTGVHENWTGFVNYDVSGESIQAYVILPDGHSAAALGSAVPVPPPDKRKI